MKQILLFASTDRVQRTVRQLASDLVIPLVEIQAREARDFALGTRADCLLLYEISRQSDAVELCDVADRAREKVLFIYHEASSVTEHLFALCRSAGSWRVCDVAYSMLRPAVKAASGRDPRGRVRLPSVVRAVIAGRCAHSDTTSLAVAAVVVSGFGRSESDRTWKAVPILAASLGLSQARLRSRVSKQYELTATQLLARATAEWMVQMVLAGTTLKQAAAAIRIGSVQAASRLIAKVFRKSCTREVERRRLGRLNATNET
jgi:hypothetical protein